MPSPTEAAKQMITSSLEAFSNKGRPIHDFAWVTSESRVANRSSYIRDHDELRKKLRKTEAVEELLQQMLSSASDTVKELRSKYDEVATKKTFDSLPDEVLRMICELACQHPYEWNIKKLSLVSWRFRRAILNVPALWSRISSPEIHANKAKLFASRASTPNVFLKIKGSTVYGTKTKESERDRVISMYKLSVAISPRIRRMMLRFSDEDIPHVPKVRKICSRVALPVLEELTIICFDTVGRKCKSLFSTWKMPSLQKLDITDILPDLDADLASRIETVSIQANRERSGGGRYTASELLKFLRSLSSVKDLRFSVRSPDLINIADTVTMESVQSLTLGIQNKQVSMRRSILDIIEFPSLTSFKLELGLTELGDLGEVLGRIRFKLPPASVTKLALAVSMEYEDHQLRGGGLIPLHAISDWMEKFGKLESMTLESDYNNTHGLFAFANAFDAIQVIGSEEKPLTNNLMDLLFMWPSPRTAIIESKDLKVRGAYKYVDSYDPDYNIFDWF